MLSLCVYLTLFIAHCIVSAWGPRLTDSHQHTAGNKSHRYKPGFKLRAEVQKAVSHDTLQVRLYNQEDQGQGTRAKPAAG